MITQDTPETYDLALGFLDSAEQPEAARDAALELAARLECQREELRFALRWLLACSGSFPSLVEKREAEKQARKALKNSR